MEILSDNGIGGTLEGRPGIQRALALIENKTANVLVCSDSSRLSRSLEDLNAIRKRVENAGGRIVFVFGHDNNDAKM